MVRLAALIAVAALAWTFPAAALSSPRSAPNASSSSSQGQSTEANALIDAIAKTDQLSGVALVAVNGDVVFKRAFEPGGIDRYQVSFRDGAVEADIKIDDKGLLDSFQLSPVYN